MLGELLKTALASAFLFTLLTLPVDLAAGWLRRPVRQVLLRYALPLVMLGGLGYLLLFYGSLNNPHLFSPPGCALSAASLSLFVSTTKTDAPCLDAANFRSKYEYRFSPEQGGYASGVSLRVAYDKGQPGRFEPMNGAYDLSLHDAQGDTLLAAFDPKKNYFAAPGGEPFFLSARTPYLLKLSMKERPGGFKACAQEGARPDWKLDCFVPCAQDSDCDDQDKRSADSCVNGGGCQAYCEHGYGWVFTTRPAHLPSCA